MHAEKKRFQLKPFPRELKRVLLWGVVIFIGLNLLLLTALSIYVSSSKERLIGFLDAKLNETVLGKLKIDEADITVWQSFPKIGVKLTNVTLSDSLYHKPFLKAGAIIGKAGILDLMGKKVKITSIKIEDAQVYTFIDSNGYTNSYVVKPQDKPARHEKKHVVFNNVELENVTLIREDAIKNKRHEIQVYDAEADISMSGSKYYITLDEDVFVRGLGFNLSKGYWLENQRVEGKWKLEFDTSGSMLSFKNTRVKIQDQPVTIKGNFYLKSPTHFHLEASTKEISYDAAMAILKPTTSEKLKKIKLSGALDIKALLDGSLAYRTTPFVKVDFTTTGNTMNTPVINLSDCSFSGNYINQLDSKLPQSDNNSRVSIDTITGKWGDIELTARNITITDLLKPGIRFELLSQCTLPQLDEQLASNTLHFIEGNAKLYLAYNGPLIADPSLLDQVNAHIEIQHGKIVYVPRSITFSECNGAVNITGNSLLVENLRCDLNTNQFVVNITGQNLNRISNKDPGKATINCSIYTPALDLSDFKALFAKKGKKIIKKRGTGLVNTARSIDNAVENGDLFIDIKARQVSLHHFTANNVAANVFFKEDNWEIKKASLQHANGKFDLSATVKAVSDDFHRVDARINLQHIDVRKLFYAFDNFGQTDIIYNNIKGVLDCKANIKVGINSAGKLVDSTMNGYVDFSLIDAALINLESLKNLQKIIFKNRNLDYVEFAEIKNTFTIQKQDIYIPRMPIQSSAITMYIDGVYSFADRTDISIQVPISSLTKGPQDDYKTIDKAKAEKPGASIYLRAKNKNGQVKIGLDAFNKLRRHKKNKQDN